MSKDFDLSKITGREPALLTEDEQKQEAEPEWLSLADAPLTPDMVGMWAWVREVVDTASNKSFSDCYAAQIQVDLNFHIPMIYNLDRITHYQIIGLAPQFKEKP